MPSVDQITGYLTFKKAKLDSKAYAESNFEIVGKNVSKLMCNAIFKNLLGSCILFEYVFVAVVGCY